MKIVISDPPVVSNLVDVEATINGVTLGEDGAVYYTDQGSGQVYRVTAEGAKTQVTTSPVSDANGIAFGPDGGLYVLTYVAAQVTRLTVVAGKETARTALATITGGRNADGIAFDASGNLYVTATGLFKISANGQTQSALSCGTVGSANVDFGAGALACTDIYSAGNGGLFRCANATAGAKDKIKPASCAICRAEHCWRCKNSLAAALNLLTLSSGTMKCSRCTSTIRPRNLFC